MRSNKHWMHRMSRRRSLVFHVSPSRTRRLDYVCSHYSNRVALTSHWRGCTGWRHFSNGWKVQDIKRVQGGWEPAFCARDRFRSKSHKGSLLVLCVRGRKMNDMAAQERARVRHARSVLNLYFISQVSE